MPTTLNQKRSPAGRVAAAFVAASIGGNKKFDLTSGAGYQTTVLADDVFNLDYVFLLITYVAPEVQHLSTLVL